ncbi:hypothetical protein FQN52_002240 [Onygenales sp. PD_12]|nr:hypothetical protein FQN52_002240 [Onygenales sp. PD_12]
MSIPIIDSHIHLFAATHIPSLAWQTPDGPLHAQHSVREYRNASSSIPTTPTVGRSTYVRGFVFLETDRISSLAPENWSHALDEVSFLARVARGEPIEGEGHEPADRNICLAIIPWAPVPAGPDALAAYLSKVRERTLTEEVWKKVRGFRYLLQDKPAGTMLGDQFVEGLRFLGRRGMTFDLGVDARQAGLWQLEEAVEMLRRVYTGVEDEQKVKVVVNHLCKPNLHLAPDANLLDHPDFIAWKGHITSLSRLPHTFIKLSGAFSELPPTLPFHSTNPNDAPLEEQKLLSLAVEHIQPWTDVVFDTFGPNRVMFGSDWPVCNVSGGGNTYSWQRWKAIVDILLEKRGLSDGEKGGIWSGVAAKVYGIE